MANASVDLNIPETVSKGAYGRSNDLEGVERSYVKTNPSGVLIVDLTSKGIWDYAGRTREREWGNSTCRPSTNCRCGGRLSVCRGAKGSSLVCGVCGRWGRAPGTGTTVAQKQAVYHHD